MLTRSQFISAGLATLAAPALLGRAAAQSAVELKVSHYLPPNHTFQKELVRWSEDLDKGSGGRLKLRIYPASQLGPVNRQFDMARSGVADIAVGLHGATPGRFPLTELVSLPFETPAAGSSSEVTSRRLTELAPNFIAPEHAGMKLLWMAVTNPLLFHTAKTQIRSINDFRGLRIRYAGEQFAEIISLLGASPLPVPPGETQDGLAKGIIDGATFPYEATQSFDLGTVVKYSLEPGVSAASFAVAMNQPKFDGLPPDLKTLIESTTGPAQAARFGAAFDAAEKAGRDYMVAKGVQIITLSGSDLDAVKSKLQPMTAKAVESLDKAGKPASAFLAAYRK